jgi:hypothetical protein
MCAAKVQLMARVQLVIPDRDRDRFVAQARREGVSLSAWLRAAGEDRLQRQAESARFDSTAQLRTFFDECDRRAGDETEPDWQQHRQVIDASRRRGATDT